MVLSQIAIKKSNFSKNVGWTPPRTIKPEKPDQNFHQKTNIPKLKSNIKIKTMLEPERRILVCAFDTYIILKSGVVLQRALNFQNGCRDELVGTHSKPPQNPFMSKKVQKS